MKTTWTNVTMAICTACFVGSALAMEISDVVARQRWPWSRLVDIDYVLTCDATQRVDIVIAAKDGSDTLTLPAESLSGDLYGVAHGPRRIIWDPTKTACTNSQMLTQFSVTLAPTKPPLYMIVDLTKTAGAVGQTTYVYEADLASGVYGTVETNPVAGVNSIVWTGVTNDVAYATSNLVLRRVSAGSFTMGSPAGEVGRSNDSEYQHTVSLTKDFYIGVFEITQKQWHLMMGNWPSMITSIASRDTRPVETITYYTIREDATTAKGADDPLIDWPSNTAVNAGSFMGVLRAKTGIHDFDLPTDAQWEYAYRAGTMTALYSGVNLTNTTSDAEMTLLGRYKCNGGMFWNSVTSAWDIRPDLGSAATSNLTAKVGTYLPNAWGLYDMAGNVAEICLDWLLADLRTLPAEDPVGPATATTSPIKRVARGGAWTGAASPCRAAARSYHLPDDRSYNNGLRVVRRLP